MQRAIRLTAGVMIGSVLTTVAKIPYSCSLTVIHVVVMSTHGPTVGWTILGIVSWMWGAVFGTALALFILALSCLAHAPAAVSYVLLSVFTCLLFMGRSSADYRVAVISGILALINPVLKTWDQPWEVALDNTKWTFVAYVLTGPAVMFAVTVFPVFLALDRDDLRATSASIAAGIREAMRGPVRTALVDQDAAHRLVDASAGLALSGVLVKRAELHEVCAELAGKAASLDPKITRARFEFFLGDLDLERWRAIRKNLGHCETGLHSFATSLATDADEISQDGWLFAIRPLMPALLSVIDTTTEVLDAGGAACSLKPHNSSAAAASAAAAATARIGDACEAARAARARLRLEYLPVVSTSLLSLGPTDVFAIANMVATLSMLVTDATTFAENALPRAEFRGSAFSAFWVVWVLPLQGIMTSMRRLLAATAAAALGIKSQDAFDAVAIKDVAKFTIGSLCLSAPLFLTEWRHFARDTDAHWGFVIFLVSFQVAVEDTIQRALMRIVGTVLGIALALVGAMAFNHVGHYAAQVVIVYAYRSLVFLSTVWAARKLAPYGLSNSCWVLLFIIDGVLMCRLGQPDRTILIIAASRVVCTLVGIISATVIALLIFPHRATHNVRRLLGATLDVCGETLEKVAHGILVDAQHGEIQTADWDSLTAMRYDAMRYLETCHGLLANKDLFGRKAAQINTELRALAAAVRNISLHIFNLTHRLKRAPPFHSDTHLAGLLAQTAGLHDITAMIGPYTPQFFQDRIQPLRTEVSECLTVIERSLVSLTTGITSNVKPRADLQGLAVPVEVMAYDRFAKSYERLRGKDTALHGSADDLIRFAGFAHVLGTVARGVPGVRSAADKALTFEKHPSTRAGLMLV